MKRVHLAVTATALLLCTYVTSFLPASWSDILSGPFIDRADAQGGFSKDQLRVMKGKEKMKQMKMGKNEKGNDEEKDEVENEREMKEPRRLTRPAGACAGSATAVCRARNAQED